MAQFIYIEHLILEKSADQRSHPSTRVSAINVSHIVKIHARVGDGEENQVAVHDRLVTYYYSLQHVAIVLDNGETLQWLDRLQPPDATHKVEELMQSIAEMGDILVLDADGNILTFNEFKERRGKQ